MASRNETVYQLAQDWKKWNRTKKFVGQPPQKNILDRSEGSGIAPDADLSPDLAAFNISIKKLEEENPGYYIPFMFVYCDQRSAKAFTVANSLGIERPAFYDRAHVAANIVHKHALELLIIYQRLRDAMKNYV